MIGKFGLLVCLFGLASAGNLYGGLGYNSLGYSSLGYGSGYGSDYGSGYGYGGGYGYSGLGYGGAIAPYSAHYSAPIVSKAVVAPVVKTIAPISYAPAVSHVSQYNYHGSPLVRSYAAPLAYSSYGLGHSAYAPALSYGGYGHGYSLGGYGYGGNGW